MTKKFWNDWQKRFDQTQVIYMKFFDEDWNGYGYYLYYPSDDVKILKSKFEGDTLTLITEQLKSKLDRTGLHYYKEKITYTVERKNIKTVYFKKYE